MSMLLWGCTPISDSRGYRTEAPVADQIKVDASTREDVIRTLGSPSSQSNFGDETWYYISAVKERRGILAPEVVDQQVTQVVFDTGGIVKGVKTYGLKDSREVNIVSRETPTEGHKLGFIEQIVGNLGRFNKDVKDKPGTAGRGSSRTPY